MKKVTIFFSWIFKKLFVKNVADNFSKRSFKNPSFTKMLSPGLFYA